MSQLTLIALAHTLHVAAGVLWAGSAFLLAFVVSPLAAKHAAEGAGRWAGLVARRAGPMMGVSALLTVLSGIYLFAALHAHDDSSGAFVLRAGALAALLALAAGIFVGRPAARRLAALEQAASTDGTATASLASAGDVMALRRRATLSNRAAAVLLGAAVLAMAVFRYASAFGA